MSPEPIQLSGFLLMQLRVLQILGLCPVSLQLLQHTRQRQPPMTTRAAQKSLLVSWQYVHIISFILFHLWSFINHPSILYNFDGFGFFNDVLKVGTNCFAHYVSLVETLLQRNCLHRFLQIYSKSHYSWANGSFFAELRLYREFICKLIIFNLIVIAITFAYIANILPKIKTLVFFIFFIPSAMVSYFRCIQICLFIELLQIELSELNQNVERLVKLSRQRPATGTVPRIQAASWEEKLCKELQQLMLRYKDLYEMSALLKQTMGLSISCSFVKEYAMILSECYWSYWMVYNGENISEYFLIGVSALTIFLLLTTCRKCMRTTHFLAHNIQKIRHDIEDLRISTRIQNFSLQMLHQRIIIDGFGFFVMNCDMACDILGTLATYMLFFIQFMPKFKKL